MKTAAQEQADFKQKLHSDFLKQERSTDEKLKQSRVDTNTAVNDVRSLLDSCTQQLSHDVAHLQRQVSELEPAHKIVEQVNTLYEDRVIRAELAIKQLQKDLDARFLQLYKDELWEAGLIGPH